MAILIQRVETVEEAVLCRKLAVRVWGEGAPCSPAQMVVHARYGGVVLLAMEDTKPIGFLFSFPASYRGDFVLWSHETAILPEYLHRGIGTMLKMTQQQLAFELGYPAIVWTFDPLISRNAYFNLHKLGASVVEYSVNMYGTDPDDLVNQGLDTDRFIAAWPTSKEPVSLASGCGPSAEDFASGLTVLRLEANNRPELQHLDRVHPVGTLPASPSGLTTRPVLTEIPVRFDRVLSGDPRLAVTWRSSFRQAAERLFAAGYVPQRMLRSPERSTYIWTKTR